MERRLLAILAADVVDYSRLMNADEAGTLHALRRQQKELIQPLVAGHGGRVVKLMGDGVLAEFASVVQAVACAAELQRRIAAANAALPPAERHGDGLQTRLALDRQDQSRLRIAGRRSRGRWCQTRQCQAGSARPRISRSLSRS